MDNVLEKCQNAGTFLSRFCCRNENSSKDWKMNGFVQFLGFMAQSSFLYRSTILHIFSAHSFFLYNDEIVTNV